MVAESPIKTKDIKLVKTSGYKTMQEKKMSVRKEGRQLVV